MAKRGLIKVAAVLALAWSVGAAHAKWQASYADSPYRSWYAAQFNKVGQWCCDQADGHAYYDNYTMLPDGGVTLADNHVIPAYMVLKTANPTGHAVWWYVTRLDGSKIDYCFAPGPTG